MPKLSLRPHPLRVREKYFPCEIYFRGRCLSGCGHNSGLEEGMLLHLVHADPNGGTTEAVRLRVRSRLPMCAYFPWPIHPRAAEIIKSREDLAVGDIAYLDTESVHVREEKVNAAESENYPAVVTFSYGDPLDEEIRATTVSEKAGPPMENQMRGRIGLDLGYLSEPGGVSSRQVGLLIDADISRIGGTHWNFTGYWRGDLKSQNSGNSAGVSPLTLNDLLNRTYHLGLYYQNPDSVVTMGVGRLYLPYAPSLSTIDGGYFGYRVSQRLTVGVFGGSTPDPTSWSYAPNQRIAGTFVNYENGDFDHLRLNDTFGLAVTSIGWHIAREFAFAENTISLGRTFSIYNSLQFDKARTALGGASYGTGLTQSFSSIRFQPIHLLTFDLNHNYLRNLPTFDPVLISTGLLDQYLFQGLSGGVQRGIAVSHRDFHRHWQQQEQHGHVVFLEPDVRPYGSGKSKTPDCNWTCATRNSIAPSVKELTNLFLFPEASPTGSTFNCRAEISISIPHSAPTRIQNS